MESIFGQLADLATVNLVNFAVLTNATIKLEYLATELYKYFDHFAHSDVDEYSELRRLSNSRFKY